MAVTPGVIREISAGETPYQPVVQVLEIRSLAVPPGPSNPGQSERFKLKISDGTFFMQAMLTTQHNNLVHDGSLLENGIIRLDEYVCNVVQDRKICILVSLTVLSGPPHYGKVGNPIAIEQAGAFPAPAPAAPEAHYGMPPAPQAHTAAGPSATMARPAGFGGSTFGAAPSSRPYGSVVATASETPRFVPVASLNPYNNKWTIKVRVTAKSDKRSWSNARGEGSLFSVDLLDSFGTQIRGTFFREAVDMFYDLIQKDSVYFMSNGRLKAANKQFSSIPNDYEITFDKSSIIQLAPEDKAIKHVQYSFVPITSLETAVKDTTVDILGMIKDVSATHSFTSKAGKELVKREVTLVDASATSVALTLWGSSTEAITEASVGNILAVKSARVGEFGGGKSLSSSQSSVLTENPDLPEAHKLKVWWDTQGSTAAVTTLSSSGGGGGGAGGTGPTNNVAARKTFAAVKAEGLGSSEAGDVFTVKGTINYIKSDGDRPPWYPACITANCNKKAVQAMTGPGWHCEKCNVSFPEPNYRYIMSATAVDHTGSEWISLFNDQAVTVLDGRLANDMAKIRDAGEAASAQWNSVFQAANFRQYMFRLKAKKETVNDQLRTKVSVLYLRPVEYGKECRALLDAIKAYDAKP